MIRRTGSVFVILAILIVLTGAIVYASQSNGPESTGGAGTAPANPTAVRDSASSGSTPTITPPSSIEATPPPESADTEPTHTPQSEPEEDDAQTAAPLAPFTPRIPEGSSVEQLTVEAPLRLQIPAIGVDTDIEWVGVDDEGNMDVPSTYESTAWYQRGPRPGMVGNSVIAGHLDSKTGPAVFYRLGDLQPGDEIIVITHDGEELRFAVDGAQRFESATAPVADIFGASSGRHLNLITCEGNFDTNAGQYDERLVVFTTLISS